MESEQEDLNKKLAVSKTEKFLMYISNTKYFLEQSVSKLLWILHSEYYIGGPVPLISCM